MAGNETTLSFLGGAGTVTGSKTLFSAHGRQVLVDCGLFQGIKPLRLRNRQSLPFAPNEPEAVLLTHAHLDHTGYLPRLVKDGYTGPIYASRGTRDLAQILLADSGYLQEEDARYAARKGFSKHHPPLPLYTEADAEHAARRIQAIDAHEPIEVARGITARLQRAGHILGATSVLLATDTHKVLFSGDLGRDKDPTMAPPEPPPAVDAIVMESTYGARHHGTDDPQDALGEAIRRTADRDGIVMIPAFAVGRTQNLLVHLHRLLEKGQIPDIPIYVNSPMASEVTSLYAERTDEHGLSAEECRAAFSVAHYVRDVEESKRLNQERGPLIIIAGSGMMTGGRILHHLRRFGPHPENTIVFVGYQAPGTRGDRLLAGETEIKMHGRMVPIRAELVTIDGMSGHADQNELVAWLAAAERPPGRVLLNHGEPESALALMRRIDEELGLDVQVVHDGETVELGSGGDGR